METWLSEQLDGMRTLVLAWSPGQDRPMTVYRISIGSDVLVQDVVYSSSPVIITVPSSHHGKRKRISWTLAPSLKAKVSLLLRRGDGQPVVLGTKSLKRAELWSGEKKNVLV